MRLKNAYLIATFVCLGSPFAQALVQAQLSQQGDTVHLEVQGQSQWDYDLQKKDQKGKSFVELTIPPLNEKSVQQIEKFSGPLVTAVHVNGKGPDGKMVLTFELSGSSVEAFDYLTEKPSRLIVDLFKSQSASKNHKAESESKKSSPAKPTKSAKANVKQKSAQKIAQLPEKGAARKPATTDVLVVNEQGQQVSLEDALSGVKKNPTGSVFDGGDPNFDRFAIKDYEIKEDSIIASQQKVYLDFPMLQIKSPYLEIMQTRKPVYEITPEDTDENKQARLLLTLYQNKRYNVFQKTVEWFLKEFPQSKYDEMVRFMWADCLFAQWVDGHKVEDFDLAMIRYRQALEKYPNSPLVERTMMLMGFATLDRGDYLGTLRLFHAHLQKRPNSPNKDIARFGIADAYLKINRYEEAAQVYSEIEKEGTQEKDKIQASYLKGDVAFQKKDYKTAVEQYQAALKKYPQAEAEYPNAIYNQAAAYFGLKDYRKSLDLYRDFIKKFPSQAESGFAMTRIGELLDILGADKSRVLGTYLETYFRYGDSPSAVVARLRMLSERMNTMKAKEVEKAVKDIQELAKSSDLPQINQFATIMIAEGFSRRKEYDKANDLLMKFYQDNPTSADTKLISNRIVQNINSNLKDLVDHGDFLKALKLHSQYADNWLKGSDRIDTKYNVGRAFEQAGDFKEAKKLYQETLNEVYAMKGTTKGKERSVFEQIPNEDELNLRLASVLYGENQMAPAFEALKTIKDPQTLSEKDQIERVQLAADLLDRRGETDSAIRYLTELLKEWSGVPELVAEPYLKLAQLEVKQSKIDDAIESLKKIGVLMEDSHKVAPQTHARSLEMLGDLQIQKGQKDEAVATYEKLVNSYEKSYPLASYRYKVGKMYFEKGEVKKASEVWNELKNDKNDFWYKMSQEQLQSSNWKDEYKKYIKRIPAMSESAEPAAERK